MIHVDRMAFHSQKDSTRNLFGRIELTSEESVPDSTPSRRTVSEEKQMESIKFEFIVEWNTSRDSSYRSFCISMDLKKKGNSDSQSKTE